MTSVKKLTRKTRVGYPRDPETGERLCRLCRKPKSQWEKGRRTWCSQECVERYSLATSSAYLRMKVYERDRGVCALCGFDTKKLDRFFYEAGIEAKREARRLLAEFGFDRYRSYWDADHIVPLAEAGSTDLKNVQTLCQGCHKQKTAEQASRRGKQRRLIGRKHRDMTKLWRELGLETA